jgi:hypothetical protein
VQVPRKITLLHCCYGKYRIDGSKMTHHGQMKLEPEVPRRRRALRTMDNVEGTVFGCG